MIINNYGLFRDFTTQEAQQMKEWATNIVLHGKVAHPAPEWITAWMESNHYDERQRLLTVTCALPQRVLLSLVMYEPIDKAQAAVTPQPEDKVRLVRVPTKQDCKEYDYTDPEQRRLVERRLHTTGTVLAGKHECGCLKVQMAHSAFVKAWPQSCIEIVDAK